MYPCNKGEIVDAEVIPKHDFTGENYTAEFVLDSDTETEYSARIIIKNTGSSPIESWKMSLVFQENISSIYNASISSHEGDTYIIKVDTWNQDIPVNEEILYPHTMLVPLGAPEYKSTTVIHKINS